MSAIDKAEDLPARVEKRQGAEDAERIAPEKAQKAGKTRDPQADDFDGVGKNRRQGETMNDPCRRY